MMYDLAVRVGELSRAVAVEYDGRCGMMAKRWLWITLALLVAWTGVASAQVSMTPDPIAVGNVRVGMSGNASGQLHSGTNNVNVDVVIGTCSGTGTGMFTLTSNGPGGTLTNLNLNSDKTITATYTAMTRGPRSCLVNVYDTGTMTTPLVTFTVSANGIAPIISTTPVSTYTYPAVRYNNAASVHTSTLNVQIANNGDAPLIVNNITTVGGLSADYLVTGTLPATIINGSPQTFVVTFDPSAAGASSTTLQIDSDDPVTPTKNISLSGTGATGIISVTDIPFGAVAVGASPSSNITVTNIGGGTKGPLAVTQATLMNNSAGWFKFNQAGCVGSTTTCALALSITSGNATVPIMCNPPTSATTGSSQSAMVVFTSDTDDATDSIAMVSCTAGRADIAVDTMALAFGDQLINATSAAKNVMLTNNGNIALTYSLSFGGTDPTQFLTTSCTTNCTLSAGASINLPAQFRPTTVGMKSATFRITPSVTTPSNVTFIDIALTGNGVAPTSVPSALSLAFGNIDVGDTSTAQTLTVMNTGTYPLSINAAFLFTGAADYVVSGATTGPAISITVNPMQSVSWMIACKPSVMNSRPGTFRISSNHNGAATNQDIGLSCNGLLGQLAFIAPPPNPYDFGGVRENDTRQAMFTLRNTGNTPVTNITVAFTGTGTGYTFAPTTIASIAGGAQVTVTVTFAPLDGTYGGLYTGTYSGMWGTSKTTMASQTVNGDGLTTGFDTLPSNPNALDFGDVRFDKQKALNINIVNTAGTTIAIRDVKITIGTAMTGEFQITGCFKNAIPIFCPTMGNSGTWYSSSGVNDTIVVQVTLDPANRVAAMDATFTVTSDLMVNPARSVLMKANSITAGIGLNPSTMVLDFGPTDLDAVPVSVTRMVRLTNTGAAPLDFQTVTKSGGPLGNVRFSFSTTTAPFTLNPNGNYDIMVTYTPVAEKPSNQPDTGSIVFGGVAGAFGGPMTITIQCTGYGVDRHLSVAPAPTFPDTYTMPEDPPVRPVTITNNGDAPLNVTATMITNEPIWTLQNPDPVSVPGRGTYDFNVAFAPIMAGKAPTGRLTILDNDNGLPMASVDLDGNGIDRQIAIGPPTIDFGYVGLGMTVKLSEIAPPMPNLPSQLLTVASPMMWTIDRVEIAGTSSAFRVLTLDGTPVPSEPDVKGNANLIVRLDEPQQFDIEFTPPYEGEVEGSAIVVLGSTSTMSTGAKQNPITLKGRGLYVDTGGGGGCSTGRGSGIAMVLVVLALVLGRRRRGAVAAVLLVGATTAHAGPNDDRNITVTMFDPTPAAKLDPSFHVQGADVAEPGAFGMYTLVTYANEPLFLRSAQNNDVAIEHRTTLELGAAYAFRMFELGLRIPVFMQSGAAEPLGTQRREMWGVAPGATAWGDLTAHGKYQIGARGDASYGISGALTAPIASKQQFAGNTYPTGRAQFLLSIVHGPFGANLNAGGVVRAKATYGSWVQGPGAVWGAGVSWRVLDKMWVTGEMFGELIPGGHLPKPPAGELMGTPELGASIEWLAGMRYQMARTTNLGIAVGRGVLGAMGEPNLRGVMTLAYTPSAVELKPLRPPRPPEPEKDADADGIKDELDTCPNEPEDKDLFDDADGCPDLDNDGDGIPDNADKCPLDAEDRDNFRDDDGCPDKDNDGDGVPDDKDKCPLVAEDKDGVADADGCPDPDNDGDGLLDKVDKCPNEPEIINGNNDDDGCPDKGNALVVLSPDRIETLESVQFNGTRVAKSSHNVLGQIGATLRAHSEIARVRLTVHVQPTSSASADKTLSEQRAKAVRDWLVEYGIDPLRLQASGFGGTKPLVPASSKGAQQINDRLELIILERK